MTHRSFVSFVDECEHRQAWNRARALRCTSIVYPNWSHGQQDATFRSLHPLHWRIWKGCSWCSWGRRCARGKERHGVTPASVQVLQNAGHADVWSGAQHLSSSTSQGWAVDFVADVDQPQQLQASTPITNPQVLSGSNSERRDDRIS